MFVCYVFDSGAAPTEWCATSCSQLLVQPCTPCPQLVPTPGAPLAPNAPWRWNSGRPLQIRSAQAWKALCCQRGNTRDMKNLWCTNHCLKLPLMLRLPFGAFLPLSSETGLFQRDWLNKCVCVCVCSCTRYILTTKNLHCTSKVRTFWDIWTSKDWGLRHVLRLKLEFGLGQG